MANTASPSSMIAAASGPALLGEGAERPAVERRGLRLETITMVRWISIAGQILVFAFISLVLGFQARPILWSALVGVSAALNLGVSLAGRRSRLTSDIEAVLQLGFDVVQLAAVLFFTGGVSNPFALLLVAPATLAASSLPRRHAGLVAVMAIAAAAILAFWSWPLPLPAGKTFLAPLAYRLVAAAAVAAGVVFTAGYAYLAAREAARMELALHVTQAVLAREQRLSALGGLAAAAAHELGTPLATISVVAKELAREGPESVREDARLLISQTERCREILRRLTETPEAEDAVHARMSLLQLLNEVIEPHLDAPVRVEAVVTGASGVDAPYIRPMPVCSEREFSPDGRLVM